MQEPNAQLDRIEVKLAELSGKIEEVRQSAERLRKYLLWGFWITVATILIPLILIPLFLPAFFAASGIGSLGL